VPSKKRVFVRRDVWFDEQWRIAQAVHGEVRPMYDNPALTNAPMPSCPLISGGPVLVPANVDAGVALQPMPVDMSTAPDSAPLSQLMPMTHPSQWLPALPNSAGTVSSVSLPPAQLFATPNDEPAWHIELFCGTSSSLRYHLRTDPKCRVMAIDIIPYDEAVRHIPAEHRDRFNYVQWDLRFITYDDVILMLQHFGGSLQHLSTCHASPPCETVSVAHHDKTPHRCGAWRSDQAVADDAMLAAVCHCMSKLASSHPHIMISIENPVSMWEFMPPVQSLGNEKGWQIVHEIHHCMVTCELDECHFPMKPTTYLLYGCDKQTDLCCFNRCDHRLTHKG
jgi:hypothetical protein